MKNEHCVWLLQFMDDESLLIRQEIFSQEITKNEIITYADKVVKASVKNNDEIVDYSLKVLDVINLKGLNEKLKAEDELLDED